MIISRRDGLCPFGDRKSTYIWENCAPIQKTCANTAEHEKEKNATVQFARKKRSCLRRIGIRAAIKAGRYALSEIPPAIQLIWRVEQIAQASKNKHGVAVRIEVVFFPYGFRVNIFEKLYAGDIARG